MKNPCKVNFIVVILAFTVLTGCATTKHDWDAAKSHDTIAAYESFLSQHPNSQYSGQAADRIEQKAKEESEKKERLRVVRLYDGAPRAKDAVAIILCAETDLRSPKFRNRGIAGVFSIDGRGIDSNYTEEIECLPGKHTIGLTVQFRPDNVPAETLAINFSHVYRTLVLKAGSRYAIVFDPVNHEADIAEVEKE